MIQCPHCNATYLEGTLFCETCGAALSIDLLANEKQTDPLRSESDQWRARGATGPVGEAEAPGSPPDLAEIPPGAFALWIANRQRRQTFEMNAEILIGRLDSANNVYPELDLTADGGFEEGVSRRHARITFRDGIPYIEDLKSTNFTYLNNVRLEPLTPRPMHHGDELRLGTVLLRVELPQ
jgi:hypothetical protein